MRAITRELARFAVNSEFKKIPKAVQHEGLRALINFIGCAAGGASEPAVTTMLNTIKEFNGKNDTVVIGLEGKLDALNAALINSLSSASLSFNDTHYATVAHPTSPVAAALVPMASRVNLSGEEFIHGLILGDEIQCRIGNILCTPPGSVSVGLSMAGLVGCIGAAVAAGKALKLNEEQMIHAIGLAANQSAGLREAHASMGSPFTLGNAGRAGLWAALLSAKGYTCTESMIEGVKGFSVSFGTQTNPEVALKNIGEDWEMLDVAYKPYPCGFVIHPIIDACLQLIKKHTFDGKLIEKVELTVNPLCIQLCNRPNPENRSHAMVSFPHWTAVTLMHKAAGLPQVTEKMVFDSDIAKLRQKIHATASEEIGREAAKIKVTMENGEIFHANCETTLGTKERPMSDSDITEKTRLQLEIAFNQSTSQKIVEQCWEIPQLSQITTLLTQLSKNKTNMSL